MNLPSNVVIAPEKLTQYLLVQRPRNDKSGFLAQAGYDLSNWRALEADIRALAQTADAEPAGRNEHGLSRGDLATVVEHLPATSASGGEEGYALEVFNAVGDSIAVIAVPVSAVEPLQPTHVLTVRPRLSPVGA
jgi:hypothetical protein